MNQIIGQPNTYDFGLDFNYALWTQGTHVTLVNVPWNNDYRDIVKFADRTALNAYIDSVEGAGIRINNLSYVKPNQPIRIDVPFNAAYKYNYLRASNPTQPIGGDYTKDFYYFITDVRYINPGTTEIIVQLDVWQTFGYDVTFGNCYIERGHIGIANTNAFNNYGRDYLTIPEGLDVGSEYQVITKRTETVMELDGESELGTNNNAVLIASTVDLKADPGTVESPMLQTAGGSFFQLLPSGASYYIWNGAGNFFAFMGSYKYYPWITQGIISITLIPDIRRYAGGFVYAEYDPVTNPTGSTEAPWFKLGMLKHNIFDNWRDSAEISNHIPERYRHLKKFYTSPYMVVEMTTWTGTPIVLKPESWADDDASVIERASLVPPNQRIAFSPFKYNAKAGSPTDGGYPIVAGGDPNVGGDDYGDYVDIATQITNFPTLAIVNNSAIAYMASNANSIAYQNNSADWSQQRALRGNQVSYDQATSGMHLANELTGIGINSDIAQTILSNQTAASSAGVGAASGIIGGAAGGIVAGPAGVAAGALTGVGGALMSGINLGIQTNHNNQSLAIRNSQMSRSNAAQVGNTGLVRDTNKNLADWASKGDYENTIAGINAKLQDIRLTQPTTSGQIGGETLNMITHNVELSVRWKLIDGAAIRRVGEYWLRYGYAVQQFGRLPATLLVMSKFTYWKLAETYISAAGMPEGFKQAIRGIFEKGVTVWKSPLDIGNIDIADNEPLDGVTL